MITIQLPSQCLDFGDEDISFDIKPKIKKWLKENNIIYTVSEFSRSPTSDDDMDGGRLTDTVGNIIKVYINYIQMNEEDAVLFKLTWC